MIEGPRNQSEDNGTVFSGHEVLDSDSTTDELFARRRTNHLVAVNFAALKFQTGFLTRRVFLGLIRPRHVRRAVLLGNSHSDDPAEESLLGFLVRHTLVTTRGEEIFPVTL